MTAVEVFVDPSCPWAWITSRWVKEVAPQRDLEVTWRSYCIDIRDEGGVGPHVPEHLKAGAIDAHLISHRMLRVMEAVRAEHGEAGVDAIYTEWGKLFFVRGSARDDSIIATCLAACGFDSTLVNAAGDEKWDGPILDAMQVAYSFGGDKTQTPTIAIYDDTPHGFKGPVMAPAPTGDAALKLWDALMVLSQESGVFEFTRPRVNSPRPPA